MEACIMQLRSEKFELAEQLRKTQASLKVQSEGWKKEQNKTLSLMFSKLVKHKQPYQLLDTGMMCASRPMQVIFLCTFVVILFHSYTGDLPLSLLSETSDLSSGDTSLSKRFVMVTIAQWLAVLFIHSRIYQQLATKILIWIHSCPLLYTSGLALQIYCFTSTPAFSETCHLNCHYRLPSYDMPTFNGHSAIDLSSVYSLCQ